MFATAVEDSNVGRFSDTDRPICMIMLMKLFQIPKEMKHEIDLSALL